MPRMSWGPTTQGPGSGRHMAETAAGGWLSDRGTEAAVHETTGKLSWLVVESYPSEKYEFVNWDDYFQ